MMETVTSKPALSSSQSGASGAVPQGIALLYHETRNLLIILVLFILSFTAGYLLSGPSI